MRTFIATLVLAVLLAGCGGTERTALQRAKENCGGPDDNARLGDGGYTLTLDGAGDETGGLQVATTICYLDVLEVSDAVRSRMEGTRALDGQREGTWGELAATWQYHPDNGLDIVIEQQR